MAEESAIEVARRANDWWTSVPFETLRDAFGEATDFGDAIARLERAGIEPPEAILDPDIEVDVGGFPGGSVLAGGRGLEGWLRFWREWTEPWDELSFVPSNYEQVGERHVLVDAVVTAQGRMSGTPVQTAVVQAWTIEDGRVKRYAVYSDRDLALAAFGEGAPGSG